MEEGSGEGSGMFKDNNVEPNHYPQQRHHQEKHENYHYQLGNEIIPETRHTLSEDDMNFDNIIN